MNNLPIPFPSGKVDPDSLVNWMNEYREHYDTHIEDEKIKRNFTFTLVKFINDITFALDKDSPTVLTEGSYGCGPETNRVIEEALDYLKSRDKDTGKPILKTFSLLSSNMLYDACKEFVRKVDCGDARSKRSYKQMKHAIEEAEGTTE